MLKDNSAQQTADEHSQSLNEVHSLRQYTHPTHTLYNLAALSAVTADSPICQSVSQSVTPANMINNSLSADACQCKISCIYQSRGQDNTRPLYCIVHRLKHRLTYITSLLQISVLDRGCGAIRMTFISFQFQKVARWSVFVQIYLHSPIEHN